MKADQNEEKTMTVINFVLLMNALAQFIVALARLIAAIRRRQ
jgi:hypothetical protein